MIPVHTPADYRLARKTLHTQIAAAFGRTRSGVRIPHWSVQLVTVLQSEYQKDRVTIWAEYAADAAERLQAALDAGNDIQFWARIAPAVLKKMDEQQTKGKVAA